MVDKDGNETERPSESTRTEFIYRDWDITAIDELSVAWAGAIPGTGIIKKFSADAEKNQDIANAIKAVHEGNLIDEYDLELLTASYGGLRSVYSQSTEKPAIFLPKKLKLTKKGETPVSTAHSPEIQAIIDEKDETIADLQKKLDTALEANTELQASVDDSLTDEELEDVETKMSQLETENAEYKENIEELTAKSELYDKYVAKLRVDLKAAKSLTEATDEEKRAFNESVDTMVDAANMSTLLDEVRGRKKVSKTFSRIIQANKEKDENNENNETVNQYDRARIAAAY